MTQNLFKKEVTETTKNCLRKNCRERTKKSKIKPLQYKKKLARKALEY